MALLKMPYTLSTKQPYVIEVLAQSIPDIFELFYHRIVGRGNHAHLCLGLGNLLDDYIKIIDDTILDSLPLHL